MRVLAAVLMLGLSSVHQGIAAASNPAIAPEDAHAGCYHTDLRRCMISLGSVFWFDMAMVTRQIARRNELDVNGKTAHRRILVDAKVPGQTEIISIYLTLASPAPNDEVVKTELSLPEDPDLAHTGSEYDRTRLYDAVSVLLGSHCPGLDRMALYRFYENTIKPLEIVKSDTRKYGIFRHTKQTVDTKPEPFCGAMFSVHRAIEFDGEPGMPNIKPKVLTFIAIE